MGAREVMVDANHAVVLTGVALVSGDQFAGSIAIAWSVRRRQQIEKRLYLRINRNGNTSAGGGAAAGGRFTSGGQQSLMGKGIRCGGNCRGCLYFTKPLIVDKEERAVTF